MDRCDESINLQLSEIRKYAKQNGIIIVGEYIDRAQSGISNTRPEFQKMISDSEKVFFNCVIVYKLDRFFRNLYGSKHYIHQLKQNGVQLQTVERSI